MLSLRDDYMLRLLLRLHTRMSESCNTDIDRIEENLIKRLDIFFRKIRYLL